MESLTPFIVGFYFLLSYGFMFALDIFLWSYFVLNKSKVDASSKITLILLFICAPITFPILLGIFLLVVVMVR